jgi:hypothetical protein
VAKITIGFGVILILLSAGGVAASMLLSQPLSLTAGIPAALGLVLAVLGFVALRSDKARMHALHAAVIVSLLGVVVACVRLGMVLSTGQIANLVAFISVVLLALICAAHVGLCVKSFIDARRLRKQAASTAGGQLPT